MAEPIAIANAATLTGAQTASGDLFPLLDVSAAEGIKASKITRDELGAAMVATSAITNALGSKVAGPSSSNDNALARFDGTTGKLVQNSAVTADDTGGLTAKSVRATDDPIGTAALATWPDVAMVLSRVSSGESPSFVIQIKPPGSVVDSYDLILPSELGATGQVLSIGSANAPDMHLAWTSAGTGDALTSQPLSQFAPTTSTQLRGVMSDETGSGALVFAQGPTLIAPILGTPTSGNLSNCTNIPFVYPAAVSDETTALTAGVSKLTFRMPCAMTLTSVRASVNTAPTGSTIIVDINENGTSILSTKLSIDATEKTSTTAAVPAAISDYELANDAEITIDIDQIGSTIAGAGLKIVLIGTRS